MVISLAEVFYQWETIGLFDIILPFLLVFAVIYGILTYSKIFGGQKGLSVVVAMVIGLLAIRFPFFADFLAEISPRLAVGITILLALIILIGLFTPANYQDILGWILLAIGAIIFIIIMAQTAGILGVFGFSGFGGSELIGYVVLVALLIGIIVVITTSGGGAGRRGGIGPLWGAIQDAVAGKPGHG